MTKKEELENLLASLRDIGNIEGLSIVSKDGLVISSLLDERFDGETLAAMVATMGGAAETVVGELKIGMPERIVVESQKGKLIAVEAGENAILVVLSSPNAPLGMLFIEAKKTAEKIKKLLK
jgi:hypothetical protein